MKLSFTKQCFAFLVMSVALLVDANGAVIKKQVLASVPYEGAGLFGGKVPPETRQNAEMAARKKALMSYISDCPLARRQLIERISSDLDAHIMEVVPQLMVLNEQVDKDRKIMEISATASVDESRIDSLLASKNSDPSSSAVSSEERPPVVFVFIARKVGAITTSDGKRVEFVKKTTQNTENENVEAGAAGIQTDYNLEDLQVKEFGGKNIDKAQQVEWVPESVGAVDAAVNEVFSQAGYECTDPVDVEDFNLQAFKDDYGTGDDVTPATRQQAIRLLREYEVGIFSTGRMDITLPSKHPVSGLPQVFVKLPKTVASVSGEYYQGVGDNVQVATQNALLAAAKQTAIKLVDQLRAKGL
jgi:hypothetical protein